MQNLFLSNFHVLLIFSSLSAVFSRPRGAYLRRLPGRTSAAVWPAATIELPASKSGPGPGPSQEVQDPGPGALRKHRGARGARGAQGPRLFAGPGESASPESGSKLLRAAASPSSHEGAEGRNSSESREVGEQDYWDTLHKLSSEDAAEAAGDAQEPRESRADANVEDEDHPRKEWSEHVEQPSAAGSAMPDEPATSQARSSKLAKQSQSHSQSSGDALRSLAGTLQTELFQVQSSMSQLSNDMGRQMASLTGRVQDVERAETDLKARFDSLLTLYQTDRQKVGRFLDADLLEAGHGRGERSQDGEERAREARPERHGRSGSDRDLGAVLDVSDTEEST